MSQFNVFLLLMLTLCQSHAVALMRVGDEKAITFTGDLLHLHIVNPKKRDSERFTVCFKSHSNNIGKHCPRGYASLYYWSFYSLSASEYQINRRGKLVGNSFDKIYGDVVFNADGSVTIKVVELPYGCFVKLLNAEEVIPTTTTTTLKTTTAVLVKEASNNIVFFVIGGLALILFLIVGGATVWICWSRKSKTRKEAKCTNVSLNGSDDNNGSRLTSTSTTKKPLNVKSAATVKKLPLSNRQTVETRKCSTPPTSMMTPKSSMIQSLSIHPLSGHESNTEASEKL
uniref:ZP domain-containing protein n=1 Tax=Panagrellus redivivus TaxID=6233 RepID=A0A7E4VNG5_PANRE